MSPKSRRIIGIVACLIGAFLLVREGFGIRPLGLIGVGAILLIMARRGK